VWGYISSILIDACTVFTNVEELIKQIRLPFTAHVCRMVWRNLIIFAHSIIIIIIVMIWAELPLNLNILLIPIAIIFYCLMAVSIGVLFGIACTRYRDLAPLITSLMQLLFFASPIMWSPKILTGRDENLSWVSEYNPVYYFIEIIRAPLMGEPYPQDSWLVVIISTLIVWIFAMWSLVKFRHRIAYWL
jgi:lipopolysaccharide transport system permease protein